MHWKDLFLLGCSLGRELLLLLNLELATAVDDEVNGLFLAPLRLASLVNS